ncbi:hypothetical protein CSC94_15020 [Zhengella mangrovi]|uniref:Uncharacterized protein n=1 Tax=Zhengella mangrovi TaxID=1982044 RepID=A0A2G1QL35_9HYPH|nr:hypothetical protein [Zhengella mangrovi]PHP66243.1 hypothetical protein CSC94_15020 [Zhengella mangrovi]
MNPVKATLLSVFMLTAVAMWGIGFYASDAAAGRMNVHAHDGYGIVALKN